MKSQIKAFPQGGFLSSLLYKFYMSKLPLPPEGVGNTCYTFAVTLTTSHPHFESTWHDNSSPKYFVGLPRIKKI